MLPGAYAPAGATADVGVVLVAVAVLASGSLSFSTGMPPRAGITKPPTGGVLAIWTPAVWAGISKPPAIGAEGVAGVVAEPDGMANPASEGGATAPVGGIAVDIVAGIGADAIDADTAPGVGAEPGIGYPTEA